MNHTKKRPNLQFFIWNKIYIYIYNVSLKTCTNDSKKYFRLVLRNLKIYLKQNCSLQQHFRSIYYWILVLSIDHCSVTNCMIPLWKSSLYSFFFILFFFYLINLFPFFIPFRLFLLLQLLHLKIYEWQQVWQHLGQWGIEQEKAFSAHS